jgi:hypothetical protein
VVAVGSSTPHGSSDGAARAPCAHERERRGRATEAGPLQTQAGREAQAGRRRETGAGRPQEGRPQDEAADFEDGDAGELAAEEPDDDEDGADEVDDEDEDDEDELPAGSTLVAAARESVR